MKPTYDPQQVEQDAQAYWQDNNCFVGNDQGEGENEITLGHLSF